MFLFTNVNKGNKMELKRFYLYDYCVIIFSAIM